MPIHAEKVEYKEVEALRELYRQEADCQIIHDSILRRGLADAYLIQVDGHVAGYGGVWNKYDPGQIMEFYTLPARRAEALPLFRALIEAAGATRLEAQTNMPLMLMMLYDCGQNITTEAILFADAATTHLPCPSGIFRHSQTEDTPFAHAHEPLGDWVIDVDGEIVATGGCLTHYNPPYGDLFMEVAVPWHRQGIGSYLVQEIKRVCYEEGHKPAARCNPANIASRRTLQKAGFLPCGRLLVGEIHPSQD